MFVRLQSDKKLVIHRQDAKYGRFLFLKKFKKTTEPFEKLAPKV
jgi:hypothetical protein